MKNKCVKERGKRDHCNGKVKQMVRGNMWTNWDNIKAKWCMKEKKNQTGE